MLRLGVLLLYAGCSSAPSRSGNSSASAGNSSNPAGAGTMSAGGGGGSGFGSSGGVDTGTSSSGSSGSSGGAPRSGSGSSGGGSSDGGAGGPAPGADGGGPGVDSGPTLGNCMPADTTPCSSYSTPAEDGGVDTIQLGPYGAQGDPNVGTGFENTVQSSDMPGNESQCQLFAATFSESPSLTNQLLKTSMNGITLNFALYSAYRPANWPNTPVPVITWGNGTCAQPEGYGALLRYVASYGYFVIAANSRQVGSANSDGSQPMLKALDYAAAANKDPNSPYYQKLDMTKVGAMGHSQGGGATATAASDSRIGQVIIFNANDSGVAKPYLAVSGDMDITGYSAQSMATAINGASVPAAYAYYHNPAGSSSDLIKGHLVLMLTPERVTAQTVAWWETWFRNDSMSKADFVGSSCGFCGHSSDSTNAYDYGHDNALQ